MVTFFKLVNYYTHTFFLQKQGSYAYCSQVGHVASFWKPFECLQRETFTITGALKVQGVHFPHSFSTCWHTITDSAHSSALVMLCYIQYILSGIVSGTS